MAVVCFHMHRWFVSSSLPNALFFGDLVPYCNLVHSFVEFIAMFGRVFRHLLVKLRSRSMVCEISLGACCVAATLTRELACMLRSS